MSAPGTEFESYIQHIYQSLVSAEGKNITVYRRAPVNDNRGNPYNIDVFYEFDLAGVRHRVAIECKDTQRPVERDEVIAFVGKISDMPSTIGVFISRNGIQPGAKKYLHDHGVLHLSSGDLPTFGTALAARVARVALPSELTVGQPFWTLMERQEHQVTGVWCLSPDGSGTFPLFYSRAHAALFHQLAYRSSPDVCVRGVEQGSLIFLILCANSDNREFRIVRPIHRKRSVQFRYEQVSARALAQEYVTRDLSAELDGRAAL